MLTDRTPKIEELQKQKKTEATNNTSVNIFSSKKLSGNIERQVHIACKECIQTFMNFQMLVNIVLLLYICVSSDIIYI